MSKKLKNSVASLLPTKPRATGKSNKSKTLPKITHDSLLSAVIGAGNLEKWTQLKNTSNCKSNEDFVKFLLELAANHFKNIKCTIFNGNHGNHDPKPENKMEGKTIETEITQDDELHLKSKNKKEHKHKKHRKFKEEGTKCVDVKQNNLTTKCDTNKTEDKTKVYLAKPTIASKKRFDCETNNKVTNHDLPKVSLTKTKPSIMVNISNDVLPLTLQSHLTQSINNQTQPQIKTAPVSKVLLIEDIVKVKQVEANLETTSKVCKIDVNEIEVKKLITTPKKPKLLTLKENEHDVRKAPELSQQLEVKEKENINDNLLTTSPNTTNSEVKTNVCLLCDSEHDQTQNETCPVQNPKVFISDSVSLDYYQSHEEKDENATTKSSFAMKSLPIGLKVDDVIPNQDPSVPENVEQQQQGVFATQLIDAYTQFGPLIAPVIKEVDVAEDCTMRFMFEIVKSETERIYFNAENEEVSNWVRFLRPAVSREQRNLLVVHKDNEDCLCFVTTRSITKGEELVYWQDDVSGNKKKMEKTMCGGCNMMFQHPLHYRIHCSVFHDVRYSLTIRKYHCKVCGAAVLGKENIMKHASELHNGQGAYQCKFCKKYFLRLHYLEMHRTYGCSANPHRSRPLCDFCGRKFCQPQKLKVHIKRMHSDMSEVLKEFQCKNCMKLLGSRAALQRHFKEVHQKQMDGACACSKCGKTFQNKSNLKIHMLTHSGIKPFRCNQGTCSAAFTTKQCLQFHYKKVHGYTEDMMPKIERSVDYTFQAYSGNDDDIAILTSEQKTDDVTSSVISPQNDAIIGNNSNSSNTSNITNDEYQPPDEVEVEDIEQQDMEPQSPLRPLTPSNHQQSPHNSSSHSNSISNNSTVATILETYTPNMKILTKGSKKWIGEQDVYVTNNDIQSDVHTNQLNPINPINPSHHQTYDTPKNLGYNRHESSASLLVEAALDSVCSEPNIDIDVNVTTPCTESLVNNLYINTLSNTVHENSLVDVTYSQSVDVTDSRDINLISPSVNEQISVTDDIDELRHNHNQSIGIDYSSFHQEDFSPPNSPRNFRDYITNNSPQPQHHLHNHNHHQHVQHGQHNHNHGVVASPPRYDFGSGVNVNVNVNEGSDDSNNGIGVQNLSLHPDVGVGSGNTRDGIQLDLSIYKSHYAFDTSLNFLRKDSSKRLEFIDVDNDHDDNRDGNHKNYLIDNEDTNKFSLNGNVDNDNLDSELKDFEGMDDNDLTNEQDAKSDKDLDLSMRVAPSSDIRSKFDLDLDLRKTYDMDSDIRRSYTDSLDDFRMKNYDLDNLDALRSNLERKTYESLIEDFRSDRNFEPLVLNPSELQGLDMSARGYHNYPNLNRYHHLYPEVDRPSVDLRLNYSPPQPPPAYTHPDILRVSLDLAQPTRHSVDLSLRSQIANSRLLTEHTRLGLDQPRLLPGDLTVTAPRHIPPDRLISDMSNRILSDHTTNRLLGNDQLAAPRLIGNEQRMLQDDRLQVLEQNRLLGNGSMSPVSYSGYSVSPSPYHPTALPPRPHATSPNSAPYHHYSAYY